MVKYYDNKFSWFVFLKYIIYSISAILWVIKQPGLWSLLAVVALPVSFFVSYKHWSKNTYCIDNGHLIFTEYINRELIINESIAIRDIDEIQWKRNFTTDCWPIRLVTIKVGNVTYPLRAYTHRKELYKDLYHIHKTEISK